jgi:hypothetical protein
LSGFDSNPMVEIFLYLQSVFEWIWAVPKQTVVVMTDSAAASVSEVLKFSVAILHK